MKKKISLKIVFSYAVLLNNSDSLMPRGISMISEGLGFLGKFWGNDIKDSYVTAFQREYRKNQSNTYFFCSVNSKSNLLC